MRFSKCMQTNIGKYNDLFFYIKPHVDFYWKIFDPCDKKLKIKFVVYRKNVTKIISNKTSPHPTIFNESKKSDSARCII